jgi:hypothetical protein
MALSIRWLLSPPQQLLSVRSLSSSAIDPATIWLQSRDNLAKRADIPVYQRVLASRPLPCGVQGNVHHELWRDIHDTVTSVGTPEMADQLSGAIYMQGSPYDTTCSKCEQLAEEGIREIEEEFCLEHCRQWSVDRIRESDLLRLLIGKLDAKCVLKEDLCGDREESLRAAIILAQFQFGMRGLLQPRIILDSLLRHV